MTTKGRVRETFERVEVIGPFIPAEPKRWYAGYTYSGEPAHKVPLGRLYFREVIAWGMVKRETVDASYHQVQDVDRCMDALVICQLCADLGPAWKHSSGFVGLFEREGDLYESINEFCVGKWGSDGHKTPEAET